jgi:hypothetical protein
MTACVWSSGAAYPFRLCRQGDWLYRSGKCVVCIKIAQWIRQKYSPHIDAKIARLLQVKAILTAEKTKPEPGRASSKPAKKAAPTKKRTLSAEGRARIAAAQKARWAEGQEGSLTR